MMNELAAVSGRDDSNFFVRVLKTVLPWKGDGFGEILRKAVLVASCAVLVVSVGQLMDYLQGDPEETAEVAQIAQYQPDFDTVEQIDPDAAQTDTVELPDGSGGTVNMSSAWKDLYSINNQTVGWIEIPTFTTSSGNKIINYAVVKGTDNDFYLTHSFNKSSNGCGWIFADYRNTISADGNSDNTVIYGHNLRSLGTMFTRLNQYKEGVKFLKSNPIINYSTIYDSSDQQWIIIGAFVANPESWQDNGTLFDFWNYINFNNDHTFDSFIDNVRKRSWYSSDIDCTEDDEYLTLQTCSDELSNLRYVVVARKIRADDDVDSFIASYKEKDDADIYFPAVWRNAYGNKKIYLGWDI